MIKSRLKNILPYIPGKPIKELKRQLGLNEVIKLASNENALGPSRKALQSIKAALGEINRYPDGGCFYLRQKLARRLNISPGSLIFGCGSDEIIVLAARAFLERGDEVIIARPTFLIYELACQVAGARIKFVPLNNFRYDLPAIKKAVSRKTKIIFIANPDNPTGTYVNKKEVAEFMRGLPADTIVYFDEAYFYQNKVGFAFYKEKV